MEEYDVFISYAHLDNLPLRPNEPDSGWVSKFNYVLNTLLSQELGRKARIWRDTSDMDSNNYLWDTIKENLLKSFTFVSILSPSYLNSTWCPRELRTYKTMKNSARIGNKSRIFKVFKQPIKKTQISQDLQDLFTEILATNFFEQDQSSGKTRSFNAAYGDKWEQSFYQKIDFLAQEIAQLLEEPQTNLPAELPETEAPSALKPFSGMTIYMAEPSSDLWKDYLEIRRDFIKRGATILPSLDSMKPETIEKYKEAMMKELKGCKLVVHFIGSESEEDKYSGDNPQSMAQLQMDIAAKSQAESGYMRLIWAPQNIASETEGHQKFIERLPEMTSRNVDLLRTPLELKTEMERILTGKPKAEVKPFADTAKPTIYILHDAQDRESVVRIVNKLFENGCEVWTVSQNAEAAGVDLIEEHKWYLTNCDAVLVVWNNVPVFRVRAMLSELQRIMDNGRERAFRAKGVFIVGDSSDKTNFLTHEKVIRNETDFTEFIAKLKVGGEKQ